jgi:uncharacterized protein
VEHPTDTTLHLGEGERWPLDAVTETIAIVGARGSGKTSVAVTFAEELLDAGQRVLVSDPTGVWWGLAYDREGGQNGLEVRVVGGHRGDTPLEATTPEELARAVLAGDGATIVDTSELSRPEGRRFLAETLEIVHRLNRDPLQVVLDEADLLAPQRATRDAAAALAATDDLVRRGRVRGLGVTLITQRPAVLHKDVLSQAATLITMRLPAPADSAAVERWIRQGGEERARQRMLTALPALPVGRGYLWSPGWLQRFGPVNFRRRRTFDSSATPQVTVATSARSGSASVSRPPGWATRPEVDNSRGRRVGPSGWGAPERRRTDPHVSAPAPAATVPSADTPSAEALAAPIQALAAAIRDLTGTLGVVAQAPTTELRRRAGGGDDPGPAPVEDGSTFAHLPDTERGILACLTVHGPATTTQLVVRTGTSDAEACRRAVGRLQRFGFVRHDGRVQLTDAGRLVVGSHHVPVADGADALAWWCRRLAPVDAVVLSMISRRGPLTTDDLATCTEFRRGQLATVVARLATLGLLVIDGTQVRPTQRTSCPIGSTALGG